MCQRDRQRARRVAQGTTGVTKDVELTFRQQLAEAIGEDRFELWFDRYNSPRWTESSVDVCAPDSFTLEWIQRTFHSALVRLLRQEPFDSHCLEYRLDEALKDSDVSPQAQSAPHQPNLKISRCSERSDIPVQHRARVNQLDKLVEGDHNRMAVAGGVSVQADRHVS